MTRRGTSRLPEFVDALVDTTSRALTRHSPALAAEARGLGIEIAAELCEAFRRCYFYVPDFHDHRLDARDRAIARAHACAGPDGVRPCTGERVRQLAREYGLSSVQVYCILRRQREQSKAASRSAA